MRHSGKILTRRPLKLESNDKYKMKKISKMANRDDRNVPKEY